MARFGLLCLKGAGMKTATQRGFTIVELLVTLAVVGVLLAIGAPAYSKMTKDNRMQSEAFALRGALMSARSEAQTLRATVTVCRTANALDCSDGDWGVGYMVFVDTDQDLVLDGVGDANGEQLIQSRVINTVGVNISFSQGADFVRFDSYGNTVGSNGTFIVCDDRGDEEARGLIVSAVGTLQTAQDDGEGVDSAEIPDDHDGNDLSC
ncbi:MAG: type IV fimbrial biogenesis protein FimT [Bacteroidia bacterium]|jgi:type IV fimbrial biogenesis protein FimT